MFVVIAMVGCVVMYDYGGFVCLYVVFMYGYKSVKWLSVIELIVEVVLGYWECIGNYVVDGWIGESNGC